MLVICLVISQGVSVLHAQQASRANASAHLRAMEREMWARLSDRARRDSGFTKDSGEFDVMLPIRGEPEVIVGPTSHAHEALAVGSARFEVLSRSDSLSDVFLNVRYDLRLEDRVGNCLQVHQHVDLAGDTSVVRGTRTTEPCRSLYMADVVWRSRRLARLPFSAGGRTPGWSVAPAANGTVDVYADSVVINTSLLALHASQPVPDTALLQVDSVTAGLGLGEDSWSVVLRSASLAVDTSLRGGGEWRRERQRFVIVIDSTFDLRGSWPIFEVHLSIAKTPDNPSGLAWTYAHAPRPFFTAVRWPPRRTP